MFKYSFEPLTNSDHIDASLESVSANSEKLTLLSTVLSFGRDLVPDNIFKALLTNQLMGVMTFAIVLGYSLSNFSGGDLVIQFSDVCFEALVTMIQKVILFTPLGVGSLVAGSIAQADGVLSVIQNLGALILVILFGLAFHVFIFYASLYASLTRKNPYKFLAGLPRVWMTAFGTSSSAATLTTTCKVCEDLGVSKEVINFALPIGCTVNMDGGALNLPLVVLWIAHVAGQPISGGMQAVAALTSMMLSIGGSPIPSAGVSILVLAVEATGVKLTTQVETLVAFCLALEWLIDSLRTSVNVTGDAIAAAIINHLMPADLYPPKRCDEEQPCDKQRFANQA